MATETAEKIRAIIEGQMAEKATGIIYHDALSALIGEKWEGKTPNKRLASQFAERIEVPDGYFTNIGMGYRGVTLDRRFGMYHILVGNCSMLVAYASAPILSVAFFEKHDACHGFAAKDRQKARAALLADPEAITRMASAIDAANEAYSRAKFAIGTDWSVPPNVDKYAVSDLLIMEDRKPKTR